MVTSDGIAYALRKWSKELETSTSVYCVFSSSSSFGCSVIDIF